MSQKITHFRKTHSNSWKEIPVGNKVESEKFPQGLISGSKFHLMTHFTYQRLKNGNEKKLSIIIFDELIIFFSQLFFL